jgi:Xaa-Pro aminopeptidase
MIHLFINSSCKKDPTVEYLTSYNPSFCLLAVKGNKKCMFVTSFETKDYTGLKCFPFEPKSLIKKLSKFFKERIRVVGINKSCITLSELKFLKKYIKAKFVDISNVYKEKREIKSIMQISKIQNSCRYTDYIFSELLVNAKKFKTEKEIYLFIKKKAIDFDFELSFDPIVATGKNAAKPHHKSSNTKLNGFTVIDMGLKRQYCSDMTRTLYFGKPSKIEIDEYNSLLILQKRLISESKAGVKIKDLAKKCDNILGKKMNHSLGHGVGIEVHEAPGVFIKSNTVLRNGHIITIEPGVYILNKYGIRIEDTIAIVAGKPVILTKSKKELIIV